MISIVPSVSEYLLRVL